MSEYTVGDECELDCPACGKEMPMGDVATDGCLKPGFVGQCPSCEAEYEIYDVEYSATVWAKPYGQIKRGG